MNGRRFFRARLSCFPNTETVSFLKEVRFNESFPTARSSTLACTCSIAIHHKILSRMEGGGIRKHTTKSMGRNGKQAKQTITRTYMVHEIIKNIIFLRTAYLG